MRRRRITLVASSLDVGGTSRVMTILANAWVAMGRPVAIVVLDWPRESFFPLDPRVEVRHLDLISESHGMLSAILNNLGRVRALRRHIGATRPEVVLSFGDRTNVRALLASIGAPWAITVADRTAAQPSSGRPWRWLRRSTYPRADALVIQTEAMTRELAPRLRARAVVIPNPVPDLPGEEPGSTPSRAAEHRVVALGRLVPQKGYDTLIDAFAAVAARDPLARLEIWGAGPEEDPLRRQIAALGLAGRAELAGQTDRPLDVLRSATVVALASRVEGFPNVLLEAMSLGRPVVAVDCRYGPAEIVRDGVDGFLVPPGDTAALADAISTVLDLPILQGSMGEAGREVRTRFGVEAIVARWDALIEAVAMRRGGR